MVFKFSYKGKEIENKALVFIAALVYIVTLIVLILPCMLWEKVTGEWPSWSPLQKK